MNRCRIQQNHNFSLSFDHEESTVYPKPRRLSLFDTAMNNPKAGPELLDLIFSKGGGYGGSDHTCTQAAALPPPFFCWSPPSRVSNPLTQDSRFGDDNFSPISPRSMIPNPTSGMPPSPPSSTSRKSGCLRGNYGNKPTVRIEGFDCLDRDNRCNCSIPALAFGFAKNQTPFFELR